MSRFHFHANLSEEQKKKVLTFADVQFSTQIQVKCPISREKAGKIVKQGREARKKMKKYEEARKNENGQPKLFTTDLR